MQKSFSAHFLILMALVFGVWLPPMQGHAQSLWVWQQRIDWQFKVDQLAPDKMAQMQEAAPDDLFILDVREQEEFEVSHLANAHRVDPDISPEAFKQRFAGQMQGKHVVLYCSIGWRSSELADQLAPYIKAEGATDISNLRGGIFRWHNESRPLTNAKGATDKVHPFGPDWAGLLERQWLASYKP